MNLTQEQDQRISYVSFSEDVVEERFHILIILYHYPYIEQIQ